MSGEDNITNNSTDNEFWASAKRGTEEISIQQKKKEKIETNAKEAHHFQTAHMLNSIVVDPEKMKRPEPRSKNHKTRTARTKHLVT